MTNPTLVRPKMGSGGVFLRSAPKIDPATKVGGLNEGIQLELDKPGADWHTGRVYVSSQVATSDGKSVTLKPGLSTINIRLAPNSSDPTTDLGDLSAGQSLELIGTAGDWFVARVYVSAQFVDVITPGAQPPAGGSSAPGSVPRGLPISLAELQQMPLTPAKRLAAPANAMQPALTAARVWNKYGGMIEPLATKLGIDPAIAVAVLATESGGSGFAAGPDGRPRMIIRFENHLFWFNWGRANADIYKALFVFDANTTWQGHQYRADTGSAWLDVHTNQDSEWKAFGVAQRLNDHAAKLSISMGLAQILGSNCRAIGYDSVEAMFEAFRIDERLQLLGLFNFIRADPRQIGALQQKDFVAFARIYNGPGQPDFYGSLIQGVHDGFHTLVPA